MAVHLGAWAPNNFISLENQITSLRPGMLWVPGAAGTGHTLALS